MWKAFQVGGNGMRKDEKGKRRGFGGEYKIGLSGTEERAQPYPPREEQL